MSKITLFNLATPQDVDVKATLRPGFCIVDYEGEYVFAELVSDATGQRWEQWAGSPSAEDSAALRAAIEANGGFDRTTVTVTPPSE